MPIYRLSSRSVGKMIPYQSAAAATLLFDKTNLVSYYRLDESSGTAVDSWAGKNLSNTSTTFTAGKVNNCAVFNGSSSWLESSDASFNFGSSSYSFSFWVNFTGTGTSQCLIAKYNYNGVNQRSYQLWFNANAFNFANSTDGTAGTEKSGGLSYTPTTGVWYHVVYSFFNTGSCIVYVNGASLGTITSLNTTTFNSTGNMRLGNNYSSVALNGKLDEVAVFNKALNQQDVNYLYNGGYGCQLA